MKTKKNGRVAVTVPVSMGTDDVRFVDERVLNLHPRVTSRSHYIRLLINLDRDKGVLNEPSPKAKPASQLGGLAIAA